MNTCFLLVSDALDSSPRPGNIYRADAVLRGVHRSSRIRFNKNDFYKPSKLKARRTDVDVAARMEELNGGILPILIETTPECDYVQQNWRHARLVFGVLWPRNFGDGTNTDNYFQNSSQKIFPPLLVMYRGNIYWLTFHSNYRITIPLALLRSVMPILRARKEMLTDVQHWFSAHSSRPGKTEFK